MESIARIIDLGEAAALMSVGFGLLRLERARNGKHKIFIFNPYNEIDHNIVLADTLKNYSSKTLSVDAVTIYKNIRDLKTKLHEFDQLNPVEE